MTQARGGPPADRPRRPCRHRGHRVWLPGPAWRIALHHPGHLLASPHKENDMTVSDRTTTTNRVPMSPLRRTALVAGVLYLLTFVSIPTLALYGPVHQANYIAGPGPDTPAIVGGILEMIVALACIGTAVVLFPVVKR